MIIIELAYSFHLGSDKNKRNTSRSSAKSNRSGSTSLSNNAIQNSAGLTKVDKHNYRKYDNNQNDIEIIKGSSSLVDDVKKLYKEEFDEAKEEYNLKQIRDDRKIKDYFTHISNNEKNDLACEIIIELGDKKYWDTKDDKFKRRMTNVYNKQIEDLEIILPTFKIASAIIHYDETSPHLHIVGVPIKFNNKNGMKKQVGKSDVFTKEANIALDPIGAYRMLARGKIDSDRCHEIADNPLLFYSAQAVHIPNRYEINKDLGILCDEQDLEEISLRIKRK